MARCSGPPVAQTQSTRLLWPTRLWQQTLSLGLPFMAAFLDPGAWGERFAGAMDQYDHMAGMWLVGEDLPQASNRITLNPEVTDRFGLPVANVHYDDHPNDVAMRQHGYQQGKALYIGVSEWTK